MKYFLKGFGVLLLSLGITGFSFYNGLGLERYDPNTINFLYTYFNSQQNSYGLLYTILSYIIFNRIGLVLVGISVVGISIFVAKPDIMSNVFLRTRIYTVKKGLIVSNHSLLFSIFFILEISLAALSSPWLVMIGVVLFFILGYRFRIDKSGDAELGIYDIKIVQLFNRVRSLIQRKGA